VPNRSRTARRLRLFNECFGAATDQLGHDKGVGRINEVFAVVSGLTAAAKALRRGPVSDPYGSVATQCAYVA